MTRANFCVVSLNPAVDAEWLVDDVLWEEKNLVHTQRRWAGGKGINVARWLKALGARSELIIPLGGPIGGELGEQLRSERIPACIIPLREETRVNVAITTRDGRQMRFNQPGAMISAEAWQRIFRETESAVECAHLVISGSLPPRAPEDSYARLLRIAKRVSRHAFLDCDGVPLQRAVREQPFLVKPNRHELEMWSGESLRSMKAVQDAALELSRVTSGWVLVSLGADGAMLVNAQERLVLQASAPKVKPKTTLGAGDAAFAAAMIGVVRGDAPEKWLRDAIAAGTAATQCEAGRVASQRELNAMRRRVGRVVAV